MFLKKNHLAYENKMVPILCGNTFNVTNDHINAYTEIILEWS